MSTTTSSVKSAKKLPSMSPVRKWDSLWHNDRVEVRSLGTHLHFASVDEVTEDGQIIWLVPDGGGRTLHLRNDDITLYRVD